MNRYRVQPEQKDYGNGSHCYHVDIEAETPEQAIELGRKRKCGIEDVTILYQYTEKCGQIQ